MPLRRLFSTASIAKRLSVRAGLFLSMQMSVCFFAISCGQIVGRPDQGPPTETDKLRSRAAELMRMEREITAELPIARNPEPYLVVNMSARTVELKVRGRSLRSFRILETDHPDAAAVEEPVWTLLDKKPLQSTERTKIQPGAGEKGVVEVVSQEPWGPHRMPWDYDLRCADGRMLEIRSLPSQQSGSRVVRSFKTLYRRTADWVRHLIPSGEGNHHTVQLWLSEKDSQLLFWSLPKQIKILIVNDAASSHVLSGGIPVDGAAQR